MKVHERFCTKIRFETEAKANSEVVRSFTQITWALSYFYIFNSVKWCAIDLSWIYSCNN